MSAIEQLFSEWRSLQPLKDEDQERLDRKFMLEFNFNSNHIEGNTLTYGQTEFLLLFGRVVDNANMRDLEEMKASNVGLQMVKEEAKEKEHHLTEYFIRTLHKTLLREDYDVTVSMPNGSYNTYTVHAGTYKTRPNSVISRTGERFEYASPEETPSLMADLIQWYNEAENENVLSPIELAALFHYRYIRIHPFEDGNGRISRLIVNYILARHGYPMIVVKSIDKDNYLQALNECDLAIGPIPSDGAQATIKQIFPFVSYLSRCLEQSLKVCIKAAKGESIEEPTDFDKELSLIEQNIRKDKNQNKNFDLIEERINVFNYFHRVLAEKIKVALKPVHRFFNEVSSGYYISKFKDGIRYGGYFSVDSETPLIKEKIPEKNIKILSDAQSILFDIYFSGVKTQYDMKDITIHLKVNVIFDLTSYSFDDHQYVYGTYPDMQLIEDYISKTKELVLTKIKKAIRKED